MAYYGAKAQIFLFYGASRRQAASRPTIFLSVLCARMMVMTFFRPKTLQSKLSLRFSSSSFVTKKWPLSHPNRRRLQRLRYHLQRDELLIRPPSPSLAPTKKPGHVPEPTPQDLKIVAFHASIPFVG